MWESAEEGIAGHLSNLRCLSDSENISKYLHLRYCLFLSTAHTHTHEHTRRASNSISATFLHALPAPTHAWDGWVRHHDKPWRASDV